MPTVDSNSSVKCPAAALPAAPAQKMASTVAPQNGNHTAPANQAGQISRFRRWAAVPGTPHIDMFWYEGESDKLRPWVGNVFKGNVIGITAAWCSPSPPLRELLFVTDGEEMCELKPGEFRIFIEAHAGKIFVSFLDGLHYRPSVDPNNGHNTCDTCWGTDQPDPYVDLCYLHWALYHQKGERRLLSNSMIAAQMLNWSRGTDQTRDRLRRLTVPADVDYTWHYIVSFLRGQALAGVLLYKFLRYKFTCTSRNEHSRNLHQLAGVTSRLPATVVADLSVRS